MEEEEELCNIQIFNLIINEIAVLHSCQREALRFTCATGSTHLAGAKGRALFTLLLEGGALHFAHAEGRTCSVHAKKNTRFACAKENTPFAGAEGCALA